MTEEYLTSAAHLLPPNLHEFMKCGNFVWSCNILSTDESFHFLDVSSYFFRSMCNKMFNWLHENSWTAFCSIRHLLQSSLEMKSDLWSVDRAWCLIVFISKRDDVSGIHWSIVSCKASPIVHRWHYSVGQREIWMIIIIDGHENNYTFYSVERSPKNIEKKNGLNQSTVFVHIGSANIATIETKQSICASLAQRYEISIDIRHIEWNLLE